MLRLIRNRDGPISALINHREKPKKRPSNQRSMLLPTRRKVYASKQPVLPKIQIWSEDLSHVHVHDMLAADARHLALVNDW